MRITLIAENLIDKKKEVGGCLTNTATTILARDWKGVNNYGCNVVIEVKKIGNKRVKS